MFKSPNQRHLIRVISWFAVVVGGLILLWIPSLETMSLDVYYTTPVYLRVAIVFGVGLPLFLLGALGVRMTRGKEERH